MATPLTRRSSSRVPVQIFVTQRSGDETHRCLSMNLSPDGIYVSRLLQPLRRTSPQVDLEFCLPGGDEPIRARGEICFDRFQRHFHGTGIRFTEMAEEDRAAVTRFVSRLQAGRARRFTRGT